jgi:methanogenic corrinoid protein MtbC1
MTLSEIKEILIDLDIEEIGNAVKSEIDEGTDPQEILSALTEGLDEIGKLYEEEEYFLTDLVLAGETMKEAMKILEPSLKSKMDVTTDTIVAATVRGDHHDIGKNILISMLLSRGYKIIDLGINCPENKIVNTVKESGAKVLALSSLLTMTIEEISVVDKALKDAGIREKVKMIVGGAPLTMELAKKMGADDYAANAVKGVRQIKNLLDE